MKKNYLADDEINLLIPLKLFWKKKIFILCFSLISFALSFFYFFASIKFFNIIKGETIIHLREAPSHLFAEQQEFSKENLASLFNKEFKINLENSNNLLKFYSQSKKINFSKKDFFYIEKVKEREVGKDIKYKLVHKINYDPREFINNYIFFIQNQTEKNFKKFIKIEIDNQIRVHTRNLQIAEKIFLKEPCLRQPGGAIYCGTEIFYKGSEVLSFEIQYYKNLLKEIDQLKFDYEPFVIVSEFKSFNQNILNNTAVYYGFFGMILGFFLSIFIIYFQIVIKNN